MSNFVLLDGRGVHLSETLLGGWQAIFDDEYDDGCRFGHGWTAQEALDDLLDE